MRSLTLQQLLLVAAIVLIPLFNLALRWLRHRMEAAAPVSAPPEAATAPPRLPERAERREPLAAAERARAAAPAPPRRQRPHHPALRGGRHEVRRAVVMMTILGPCRGLEGRSRPPSGPRGRSRPGSDSG